MATLRPNPEKLLAALKEDEKVNSRGRLKIYIGMAAGVGKTYSMLSDASTELSRGVDLVLGYVEPHGRKETDALMASFEKVPCKQIEVAGATLQEFDIDAALKRNPTTILIDELAHTNAPGCRHTKRWQDVEELLDAGINVHTTVNIQHFESLKEIIAQITGVIVQETVPDSVLNEAYEVEVVDLPPNELIQRLKEGKVYPVERVPAALNNFFREGNLIALRELVLRRTAERVDAQMKRYRHRHSVDDIWPAHSRIMVCVGPSPMAAGLVRAAYRFALPTHSDLIALNLASANFLVLPEEQKLLATQALQLAESLGARTITRAGQDMVSEILAAAREENVTAIVIGKSIRPRWKTFFSRSLVDELLRQSSGINIHVISNTTVAKTKSLRFKAQEKLNIVGIASTLTAVAATTTLALLSYPILELSDICMILILGVACIASFFSWKEAILASVLSVLSFDFFFIPPRFSFAVGNGQYFVTFIVMLLISLLISSLSLRNRTQTSLIAERERITTSLYELSRVLLASPSIEVAARAVREQVYKLFHCPAALVILHPDFNFKDVLGNSTHPFDDINEQAVAKLAFQRQSAAGLGTDTLSGSKGFYVPIISGTESLGILALAPEKPLDYEQSSLLNAVINQLSSALDRILLEISSAKADMRAEGEKLRSTLLSSISHDLRTPLAVVTGAASALTENSDLSSDNRRELAKTIWEESLRLTRIVRNVLDLTRLETESIAIKKEWHSLEELVGSALSRCAALLSPRKVSTHIPANMPLVEIDGYLFEQLLVNIFENAGKHTPIETQITVSARLKNQELELRIYDNGPGFKSGEETLIFNKLYHGEETSSKGFGLGLAICRAIMSAHNGSIEARNVPSGGAEFIIRLPQPNKPPEFSYA